MTGWEFWVVALCLGVGTALVLIRALVRASGAKPEGGADLAVYKDQLADITRDLARGTIRPDEAERLRAEVGRRVLEADRMQQSPPRPQAVLPIRLAPPLLILALALPGALASYWVLGAPGYSDMALAPRLQALEDGIANRPRQDAELEKLGTKRDAALDTRLAPELAAVTDPTALRDLFRQRLEAGEMQAAVRTQERLIALLGANTNAADHANLALALVVEAQGYVSPEAEAQLRETLTRDMSNELARYLVGEMFLQGGRFDKAFEFWRPIAETGNPAAPWVASIRDRIDAVAEAAGIQYALPETASPGPTDADMANAADMTPEERQTMIEGMVGQLSDRLASEGGPVEDWSRLITSLGVLGRADEAKAIYTEAKTKFEGRAAELAALAEAAKTAGLAP